jgi:hypothetical protein
MDWLRSEDLKEEKNVIASGVILTVERTAKVLQVTSLGVAPTCDRRPSGFVHGEDGPKVGRVIASGLHSDS